MQKVVARLFKNGGSRAVRIPAAWGFEDGEVTLTFDEFTRRVVIEEKSKDDIKEFFKLQDQMGLQDEAGWPKREQPIDVGNNPFGNN